MQQETLRQFDGGNTQIGGLDPDNKWPYPAAAWQRVSKKYLFVDVLSNIIVLIGVLIAIAFVSVSSENVYVIVILGLVALAMIISAALVGIRVRKIGYILRADDFVYTKGLIFQRIIAVPYGRLQLVDVKQGPLLRAFNLASLRFVTAAAGSNVELPGLEKEVAERLRDQLVAIAETRRSGL